MLLLRLCRCCVFCLRVFVVGCEVGPMQKCDIGARMGGVAKGKIVTFWQLRVMTFEHIRADKE